MYDGRIKNSVRNIWGAIINKGVCVLCPFVVRTIIIYKLGLEYAGLNSLFSSILQVLNLSELGIGSAIVFSMYKPIANNDVDQVNSLLNLYRKFYLFVGLIILFLGVLILPVVPKLIKGSYPDDINIYILYLIYLFNTFISYFLYAYKASIINAYQRNDIESNISTVVNILMYSTQIIVLLLFKNYYMYIIMLPISTIILNCIRSIVVTQKYPMHECVGEPSNEVKRGIFIRIGALIGHKLSGVVNCSLDNIVVSTFMGLRAVAQYGNYYYIVSSLSGVMAVVFSSLTASIGDSIIKENGEKNKNDFFDLQYFNCWIVGFVCNGMFCMYQDFMIVWVGKSLLYSFDIVVLFIIYFYSWQIRRTVIVYKDATGLWWADKVKPYVSMIVNLTLNLSLVKIIGVYGVLLSTIVVYTLIEGPWETIVLFREVFKCSSKRYWINLLKYTAIMILCTSICCLSTKCVIFVGIKGLLIKFLICFIVYNIVWICATCKMQGFLRAIKIIKNK